MKNKLILVLVFFLFLKSYAENIVYEIGPNTEDVIVFTASRTHNNEATSSTKLLEDFAKKLEHEILKLRVIIAITDNDTPDLPETVGIKKHQNTQKIISMIAQSKSSVVFILSDGPSYKVILTPGAANKTSPPWMIEDLHFALKKQNIPFNLKYNNIILYRLGIINDDILAEYLEKDIPAIKLSSNADIRPSLLSLISIYSNGISSQWDKHYNIKEIFGLKIISEKNLVILILVITLSTLFYIFLFSFLSGKRREKNISDLLLLWKVPILFFIINMFALYLGEYVSLFLFYLKFGFKESINFLPIIAIIIKFLFAALISSSFIYINRYLKLPNNAFIYGYLASIVCFFNIFIFSGVNLSLAIMLLEIYVLSFISYHFEKLYSQLIFFILNIILFAYYFYDILFIKDNIINVLFYSNNGLAAIFILPYSLMFVKFFMQLKKEHPNIKHLSKIITSIPLFFLILSIAVVLIYPSFLKVSDKTEFVTYNIEDGKKYISILSSIKTDQKNLDADKELPELSSITADDFLSIQAVSKNYLERVISEINIKPLIKAAIIKVIMTRDDGFPVYEANMEFKKLNEGKSAEFVSGLDLTEPFSIKFSGEKNSVLKVKVLAWFYDNPLISNFTLSNENVKNKKLIFHVIKEFNLLPDTEI